jgi:hypothetical protein
LAQSASLYALKENGGLDGEGLSSRPWLIVPFRYLSILLTAFQCVSRGCAMNWHTLFTLNAISGLVKVSYWRAPTVDLYRVGSLMESVPNLLSLQLLTIGETIDLLLSILVLMSKSLMYFD